MRIIWNTVRYQKVNDMIGLDWIVPDEYAYAMLLVTLGAKRTVELSDGLGSDEWMNLHA